MLRPHWLSVNGSNRPAISLPKMGKKKCLADISSDLLTDNPCYHCQRASADMVYFLLKLETNVLCTCAIMKLFKYKLDELYGRPQDQRSAAL